MQYPIVPIRIYCADHVPIEVRSISELYIERTLPGPLTVFRSAEHKREVMELILGRHVRDLIALAINCVLLWYSFTRQIEVGTQCISVHRQFCNIELQSRSPSPDPLNN